MRGKQKVLEKSPIKSGSFVERCKAHLMASSETVEKLLKRLFFAGLLSSSSSIDSGGSGRLNGRSSSSMMHSALFGLCSEIALRNSGRQFLGEITFRGFGDAIGFEIKLLKVPGNSLSNGVISLKSTNSSSIAQSGSSKQIDGLLLLKLAAYPESWEFVSWSISGRLNNWRESLGEE